MNSSFLYHEILLFLALTIILLIIFSRLYSQEGVADGIYHPIGVSVHIGSGEIINARSYQLVKSEEENGKPSPAYHSVILAGAREHGLPKV